MCKKAISLILVVMMLIGIIALSAVTAGAEDIDVTEAATEAATEAPAPEASDPAPDAKVIYFDPDGSGWEGYEKIGFHIWEIDDDAFKGYFWGDEKQFGAQASDGRWYYDLDAAKLTIKKGKQYGVIFYAVVDGKPTNQTYNLIFGDACIGKTAACEGTIYENPENSKKTTQAAFWETGIDATVYGPELQISSIGTVVGTCCPASTTPYQMFENFLHNTLQNARIYSGKTDQALLDDIAAALGLSRTDVENAIEENGLDVDWDRDKSSLPDDSQQEETAAPTEAPKDVPKSPQTGADMTLIVMLLMLAAAGIVIAGKKVKHN